MRSPWVFAAVAAVGLAASASAQQASQSTRQQIERLHAAYAAYTNKQDAGGIASLYTKDGVFVTTMASFAPDHNKSSRTIRSYSKHSPMFTVNNRRPKFHYLDAIRRFHWVTFKSLGRGKTAR
jgi:hypothetical protein